MSGKVVDASALVALLFNDLKRDEIALRLGATTLGAPSLIGFDVATACLKKIRAAPNSEHLQASELAYEGSARLFPPIIARQSLESEAELTELVSRPTHAAMTSR